MGKEMSYDPRSVIGVVPGEEDGQMGYRTTRESEIRRNSWRDALPSRYEQRKAEAKWEAKHGRDKKQERKDDAKWERKHGK